MVFAQQTFPATHARPAQLGQSEGTQLWQIWVPQQMSPALPPHVAASGVEVTEPSFPLSVVVVAASLPPAPSAIVASLLPLPLVPPPSTAASPSLNVTSGMDAHAAAVARAMSARTKRIDMVVLGVVTIKVPRG